MLHSWQLNLTMSLSQIHCPFAFIISFVLYTSTSSTELLSNCCCSFYSITSFSSTASHIPLISSSSPTLNLTSFLTSISTRRFLFFSCSSITPYICLFLVPLSIIGFCTTTNDLPTFWSPC